MSEQPRRTPLHGEHLAAGARMAPFAGWDMPIQYEGVAAEHAAVRERSGMFDVSHMGQIGVRGPDAEAFLQRVVSNDVAKLAPGGAQYSCLCADDGGILDDLFAYALEDHDLDYVIVTNAANHDADLARFRELSDGFDAEVIDLRDDYAMIAVQGPEARAALVEVCGDELPARMRVRGLAIDDAPALVCGTGYTGEDGVEILLSPEDAPPIWRLLASAGVTPCGLAARDTLRLESCFHLHGQDIGPDRNPIEAGLGWCCAEETGFAGAGAVAAARAAGVRERFVPFAIVDKGIPRQGNPILHGGEVVGVVTSGTHSPSLGQGIGLGYVRSDLAEPGTEVTIDVRGKPRKAEIRTKPLHPPS